MGITEILRTGLPADIEYRIERAEGTGDVHVHLQGGDQGYILKLIRDSEILDNLAEMAGMEITWHVRVPEGYYGEKGWR